jgi:hypothetical protein
MTARSLRLLPLSLACLVTAFAWPAHAGTPEQPEIVDADDDASVPPLDIAAVWFDANDTHLTIHIVRAEGGDSPPPLVLCQAGQCLGAGVALRVVFQSLAPNGSFAPHIEGYNASYVLLRVGPNDANLTTAYGYMDDEADFHSLGQANVTAADAGFNLTLPLDAVALAIPTGPTPGAYRIAGPYALSYALTCTPSAGQGSDLEGCLMRSPPGSTWDRAPDADVGLDFVFPSPPLPPPEDTRPKVTVTTTTTVTQVRDRYLTFTVTETATFTHTPFPLHVEAKGTPALGLAGLGLVFAVAMLVRRKLP